MKFTAKSLTQLAKEQGKLLEVCPEYIMEVKNCSYKEACAQSHEFLNSLLNDYVFITECDCEGSGHIYKFIHKSYFKKTLLQRLISYFQK